MSTRFDEIKKKLLDNNQEHLLNNYNNMSETDKNKLLDEIEKIDFQLIKKLYNNINQDIDYNDDKIEAIDCVEKSSLTDEEYKNYDSIGEDKIINGKLAVLTMAGGQGTRLGHNGPKGTFDLGLDTHESLFEILCNKLKDAYTKYGVYVNWYIMTSNENNDETVEFFKNNNYFNYPQEKIKFFIQGELPMVSLDGKILLNEEGFIKFASDGHGGVFESIVKSGVLKDLKQNQIEWVFIGGVDNVLVNMVDSVLIGLSETKQCLAAGKSVIKASPEEKVGVFCVRNGKPSVIEYSEISDELANKLDDKGELLYSESHILCNLFNTKRIEKLAESKLPYHVAKKKANYMDENGKIVIAEKPNAYKFESFIFDAFTSLDSMVILRVKREDEFAPVKNKDGVDSPETARELYKNYYNI